MKTLAILTLSQLLACGNKTPAENAAPTEEVVNEVVEAPAEKPGQKFLLKNLEHFGLEFTLDDSIPAGTVLTNPDEYVGKTVRVTGKVSDVCQNGLLDGHYGCRSTHAYHHQRPQVLCCQRRCWSHLRP